MDFSRWGKDACDNAKFERLKEAVIRHKEIKIVYENTGGERSERAVCPLKLSYKSKEWYLKAFCLKKQDFRLFKLNRILRIELSERTFVPRPYPEPQNSPQRTYPRIVLLFSKEIAYQENGGLIACAEMPVDAWLVGYLLSFGTQVEVLEPMYLREVLAAQAQAIYEKNIP